MILIFHSVWALLLTVMIWNCTVQFIEWLGERAEQRRQRREYAKHRHEMFIEHTGRPPPRELPRWLTELWRGITAKADH